MSKRLFDGVAVSAALLALATPALALAESFVIVGASVADGSGKPLRAANVRVEGGRIVRVGSFEPGKRENVVSGAGLVLAPGFIDVHNHSTEGLAREPLAPTQVSQGITTVLLGQDGSSPLPLADYIAARRREPPALNLALCVGHATVRSSVMRDDYKRPARPEEVRQMQGLVERAFKEGARCLSSGLEYEIGGYATTDEIVALARVARRYRGFYISHVRDEADKSFDAMRELVAIGERASVPVQNTHVKVASIGVWGKAGEALRLFDAARARKQDVTADCYPWDAWSSTILVLVPDKRYDDPVSVAKGLADVGGAQNVLVVRYAKEPAYEFRTLDEIAAARLITASELFSEIARAGGAQVVVKSMMDDDIRAFYAWPWTMVGSDGGIGLRHPRSAGTYPRVLGRFVRERQWLSLEEAVRKMTSLPAWRLGLEHRGRIREGFVADVVLFDPATVVDNATFTDPFRLSSGIEKVWVGGTLVWSEGRTTGARPGRVLIGSR